MKMAEHDDEVRVKRVSSYMLGRLETTISSVVNFGNKPPEYEVLQFDMFSYAKSMGFEYADCREAVELTTQLLFAFQVLGHVTALEVLKYLREAMMDDASPTEIQLAIIDIVRHRGKQWDREHLLACVSNYLTHFIDTGEGISYK